MATRVFDVITVIKALCVAEEKFLGKGCVWISEGGNPAQLEFLKLYDKFWHDAQKKKDILSLASRSVDELNEFLAKHGFSIRLNPVPKVNGVQGFGIVAIFDRLMRWIEKGTRREIVVSGKKYPGFYLSEHVSFHLSNKHSHMMVSIKTQTGGYGLAHVCRQGIVRNGAM